MITTYSFQADFRKVAERLAADKRRRPQPSELMRRSSRAVADEFDRNRRDQADASDERVA